MKKYKVQMVTKKFPFLDMKTRWSSEGGLQFGVLGEKGQQLKYAGKVNTHTPSTLHMSPSEVLNHLSKITLHKQSFHSERVDNVYPDDKNALNEAGLAAPTFPTMG